MSPPILLDFLRRWWQGFVVKPLRRSRAEVEPEGDGKALAVLVSAAVLLTAQHYFCPSDQIPYALEVLHRLGLSALAEALRGWVFGHRLRVLGWWAVGTFVCFFVLPALLVKLAFREKLADYGFKLRGAFADAWLYGVLFAVMAPPLLVVSGSARFQATYPFYSTWARPGPDFLLWEGLYALQFVGVEFLFRGFLVHGLRRRLGPLAIAVMVVPYCMLHFAKPLPETLGAIVAGLVLGFLSLKNRSIALGVAIHVSVAVSMDVLSLWRKGLLG